MIQHHTWSAGFRHGDWMSCSTECVCVSKIDLSFSSFGSPKKKKIPRQGKLFIREGTPEDTPGGSGKFTQSMHYPQLAATVGDWSRNLLAEWEASVRHMPTSLSI